MTSISPISVNPANYNAVKIQVNDPRTIIPENFKGNIEDNGIYNATNIEVNGIVDKSHLEATGNIVVRQGIFGKGEGYIKAGKSLWAKFINLFNASPFTTHLYILF